MRLNVYFLLALLFLPAIFFGCKKENPTPLKELSPIEIPAEITGIYSGRLPCDDCKARLIKMNLMENDSAEVIETLVADSLNVDTLKGVYAVTDSTIFVEIFSKNSSEKLRFFRSTFGNLSFMTSALTIYKDENGMGMDLIKIFKSPQTKKE